MKRYVAYAVVVLAVILGGVFVLGRHSAHSNTTAKNIPVRGSYVALGDSVAAGLGLQPYSDASACDRTNGSYPYLVSKQLDFTLTNLACSGATIANGIAGSQDVNQLQVASQLTQLFVSQKPRVISLTIGANDIEWTNFLMDCYKATCGTADDSAAINGLMSSLSTNLSGAMSQIQQHYKTSASVPPVIITGYYQVMPAAAASCSDVSGVDQNEQAWIREQFDALNSTIQSAISGYSFAHYVAVNFSGHELCSHSPWVQGLQDPAPYHPTQAGQNEIATQVSKTMKAVIGNNNL